MRMPLEGIRVVDWTIFQQGPMTGVMLGDLGAEVIKVEDRVTGDPARGIMSVVGATASVKMKGTEANFYWEGNNRNKKGIAVDVRKEKGKELIYRLVEQSDVFLQNHRKGYAEKMRLDYKTLSQHNPLLIYATGSGWGPKGPGAKEPSMDYTGIARSGIMTLAGEKEMSPQLIQGGIGDQTGALMTAYAILAALFVREREGIGQEVEASLLGSLVWLQAIPFNFYNYTGVEMLRLTRSKAGNPLWNHYLCSDGKWIAFAMLAPDQYWSNWCKALGVESLENDPRFNSINARNEHCEELVAICDKLFAAKPRDEWLDICREHGLIATPINTVAEACREPQVTANEYVTGFDDPVLGPIKTTGIPVSL